MALLITFITGIISVGTQMEQEQLFCLLIYSPKLRGPLAVFALQICKCARCCHCGLWIFTGIARSPQMNDYPAMPT